MEDEAEPDYSPDEAPEAAKQEPTEDSSEAEDALEEVRRSRRQRLGLQTGDKPKEESKFFLPGRVREALEKSKTFNEFKQNRIFRFLHLFSGRRDVLGREILRLCQSQRGAQRGGMCLRQREGRWSRYAC